MGESTCKGFDVQLLFEEMYMGNPMIAWKGVELVANHQMQITCLWEIMLTKALLQLKQLHCT